MIEPGSLVESRFQHLISFSIEPASSVFWRATVAKVNRWFRSGHNRIEISFERWLDQSLANADGLEPETVVGPHRDRQGRESQEKTERSGQDPHAAPV
jgi:hypothetical protein